MSNDTTSNCKHNLILVLHQMQKKSIFLPFRHSCFLSPLLLPYSYILIMVPRQQKRYRILFLLWSLMSILIFSNQLSIDYHDFSRNTLVTKNLYIRFTVLYKAKEDSCKYIDHESWKILSNQLYAHLEWYNTSYDDT